MIPALQVNSFVLGFASAGSALLSLGPQNVFVLKRGLSRQHLVVTVAICFGSDGLLMSLAVLGFASVLNTIPVAALALRLAGCLYLAVGSIRMLMSACRGQIGHQAPVATLHLRQVVVGAAVVSLLNPLAWTESVLVVGGLAATMQTAALGSFTAGSLAGSLLKFGLLAFGARHFSRLLVRPALSRAFDAAAAVAMAGMALLLA